MDTPYDYINDETGEIITKYFPMYEEHPTEIVEEGKVYRRVFTAGVSVHIPFQWGQDSYKFDKRPRKKRKYK